MDLSLYIGELLVEHDCVIIPGFGGFVGNHISAQRHTDKQLFHPPFKKISFNRHLINNDGLLANKISIVENITYSEANKCIAAALEDIRNKLTTNKQFSFTRIGTLLIGKENTWQFEQSQEVNYLPESFGLSSFHASAIIREPLERKLERKIKKDIVSPLKKETTSSTRKPFPVIRNLSIAASVTALLIAFVLYINNDFINTITFATLNPFTKNGEILYKPLRDTSTFNASIFELKESNLLLNSDTAKSIHVFINDTIPLTISLEEDATTVVKAARKEKKSHQPFLIVGGAFAIFENADKFRNSLSAKGFNATIIESNNHALQFVSYGSYTTRKEALLELEKIRSIQQDAWLMTN